MKIELVREVKPNGDIFYIVEKDGHWIENSSLYAGNNIEVPGRLKTATEIYNKVVAAQGNLEKSIILSTEILAEENNN